MIAGCDAVALAIVNASAGCAEGLVLLDTGFPRREGDILAAIKRRGHESHDVKHIVLTHAHPDHVGGAAALVRSTGA